MSEERNYEGIALSAIEVDDKPLPAPLEEWVATGMFRDIYMPIPNPLFPPEWIAQGEHDSWDVAQAWVRRFRYLHSSRHSQKGLEIQAMSSCAGLHELVVKRDAELRDAGERLKRLDRARQVSHSALIQLAKTCKDSAVEQDWCDTYEDTCTDYLQRIDPSLQGEVREALMRTKKVEITREVPYVVWVREAVYDVEVPYDFDASEEDADNVGSYFSEIPSEEIALLKANSRIVRIEYVEDFDVDNIDMNYESYDL